MRTNWDSLCDDILCSFIIFSAYSFNATDSFVALFVLGGRIEKPIRFVVCEVDGNCRFRK